MRTNNKGRAARSAGQARRTYTMYREPSRPQRSRRSGGAAAKGTLWKILPPLLIAAAAVFLLLFLWQWMGYRKSEQAYESLRTELNWVDTTAAAEGQTLASRLDFSTLLAQNPDTTAWLSIPGLELSLPVVQNADSGYYLRRNFFGESSNDGCLIRPSWDSTAWADGLCHIIHGHNIHTGAMFGGLDSYREEAFFSANPTFTLYTPDGDYLCRVFSAHDALADDPCYALDYTAGEDYDEFLAYLKALSLYDTGVEVPSGSRILTLSTCRSPYASNNQRFVVHAVMEPISRAQ